MQFSFYCEQSSVVSNMENRVLQEERVCILSTIIQTFQSKIEKLVYYDVNYKQSCIE